MASPCPEGPTRYANELRSMEGSLVPVRRLTLLDLMPCEPEACANCLGRQRLRELKQ